jgi:hypothetical protein
LSRTASASAPPIRRVALQSPAPLAVGGGVGRFVAERLARRLPPALAHGVHQLVAADAEHPALERDLAAELAELAQQDQRRVLHDVGEVVFAERVTEPRVERRQDARYAAQALREGEDRGFFLLEHVADEGEVECRVARCRRHSL